MDIRFPEFPAPRDTGSDPAARKSHAENSDFAEMLERSLDEPQSTTRDVASEKPREPRVADRDDAHVKANETSTAHDAAVEPQAEPAAAPQSSSDAAGQHHEQPAKQPDGVDGRVDDTAAASADTQLAAASRQPTTVPVPAPVAPGAVVAAPSASAAHPQGAAQTPITGPNAAAPAEVAAQPPVPQAATGAAGAQPAFADELMAAASINPSEPVAAKPKSAPKNDAKPAAAAGAAQPVPTPTVTVAAVPETKAAPDALPKNTGAGAEQTPAAPTTASPPIPAPVAASAGTTADAEAGTADDAQIAALVRPVANGAGTERPAGSKDAVRSDMSPADLLTKEPAVDARPSDQARTEGPSRPFGAVAPGLSVAAQAAAQQTPEQANAAERLAQLAAAADPEQTVKPGQAAADAAKGADSGPPAARTDQAGQIDSAASRNTVTDTAATTAARAARPTAHPMMTHIAAHVAQAAIDGNERISIRLSPAELGRIDVKLEIGHDGRIHAVFAADRAQTVDLLQRDARDLERALQDAGLRADSGSLSFNLRGDGRNGTEDGATGRGNREEPVAEASNPQLQAYAAGGGSTGRLDLRI